MKMTRGGKIKGEQGLPSSCRTNPLKNGKLQEKKKCENKESNKKEEEKKQILSN